MDTTDEPSTCAILGIPLGIAYRDYGLDLCREAMEGPEREQYPALGIELKITTESQVTRTDGAELTTYTHHIKARGGSWSGMQASFAREGVLNKISKFLGKGELQGGDPRFDKSVFIRGDVDNAQLATFVRNEGVQSALLALVKGVDGVVVYLADRVVSCEYTSQRESIRYTEVILPTLALAYWAKAIGG